MVPLIPTVRSRILLTPVTGAELPLAGAAMTMRKFRPLHGLLAVAAMVASLALSGCVAYPDYGYAPAPGYVVAPPDYFGWGCCWGGGWGGGWYHGGGGGWGEGRGGGRGGRR
jgi:hypothetical protein